MWTNALWAPEMLPLQWGAVIGASLAAAVFDAASRRIPNWLTGATLAGGIVWAIAAAGLPGLADGFLACCLLAFPFVVLFVFAGGGAGDAKLMGALGMWLGVKNGAIVLVSVTLSGILLAVAFAVTRGRLRPALENLSAISKGFLVLVVGKGKWTDARELVPDARNMQRIPYGLAILAGVLLGGGVSLLWHDS